MRKTFNNIRWVYYDILGDYFTYTVVIFSGNFWL